MFQIKVSKIYEIFTYPISYRIWSLKPNISKWSIDCKCRLSRISNIDVYRRVFLIGYTFDSCEDRYYHFLCIHRRWDRNYLGLRCLLTLLDILAWTSLRQQYDNNYQIVIELICRLRWSDDHEVCNLYESFLFVGGSTIENIAFRMKTLIVQSV